MIKENDRKLKKVYKSYSYSMVLLGNEMFRTHLFRFKADFKEVKRTGDNFQVQPESCYKFDMLKVCRYFA